MPHTDLTNLTEEHLLSLVLTIRLKTLGIADKLRAFCDAALCEICEICVRQIVL